jgi:EAL domain-containing protein (putative c-di-GMP-specific phosphodiesterase class I)
MILVNLHPMDLLDDELFDRAAPLSRFAPRVILEVTERASLEKVGSDLRKRVERLREMGFRIALDDIGAGYAGLTSFTQLEPEVVKLDMVFARGVDTDHTKQQLVKSLVSMCGGLYVQVIAEGVETEDERDMLVSLGCDLLQGFLFARPDRTFPMPKL